MGMTLTESAIKRIAAGDRPQFFGDANGLRLMVKPTGAKCWTQRLVIQGRRRDLGLGRWPVVPLSEARALALENRRIARRGDDPRKVTATFREVAAEKLRLDAAGFSDATQRIISGQLEQHAYPALGSLRWQRSKRITS